MLTQNDVIFSPLGGGALTMVDPEGEILGEIAVPEGAHRANRYLSYQSDGVSLKPKGVDIITRGCKSLIVVHEAAHESAVKTGYQPSAAAREAQFFARVLRATEAKASRMVAEASAKVTQIERREAAIQAKEQAEKQALREKGIFNDDQPVIEPVAELEVKPSAK